MNIGCYCTLAAKIQSEVILASLWTQTEFGGIFGINQIYERYDGANKMQIEERWVQVFIKLFYIQSKETGDKKNYEETRELRMAKWDFAWIFTLERKRKTRQYFFVLINVLPSHVRYNLNAY